MGSFITPGFIDINHIIIIHRGNGFHNPETYFDILANIFYSFHFNEPLRERNSFCGNFKVFAQS